MSGPEKESHTDLTIEKLPLTGYSYFHFKEGRDPSDLGDKVIELSSRTIALIDVSLGKASRRTPLMGKIEGEDVMTITESIIAGTVEDWVKKRFSENLSVEAILNLFAQFLIGRVIHQELGDLALSATVCQKAGQELIIASFGSNRVFGGLYGRELITSGRAFDPWASEETGRTTRILGIQKAQARTPIVVTTDGLNPPPFANCLWLAMKGYPLKELQNPIFLSGEALVVRVG